jgi:flagellar biogenesis protein FliO
LFSGFSSMVIFSTVSILCIINLILLLLWFYRKC